MASGTIKRHGFGNPERVTFPFTATKDGFVIAVCNSLTSSVSYVYITEDGLAHARFYGMSNQQGTLVFPVKTGRTYAESNISNITYIDGVRFYPFA